MSVTWSKSAGSYSGARKRAGSEVNQASAPSASTASAMRSRTPASRKGSPVSLLTKTVIGTPQARWRETHQSGRVSTIP
jgi:hypothetical protein